MTNSKMTEIKKVNWIRAEKLSIEDKIKLGMHEIDNGLFALETYDNPFQQKMVRVENVMDYIFGLEEHNSIDITKEKKTEIRAGN